MRLIYYHRMEPKPESPSDKVKKIIFISGGVTGIIWGILKFVEYQNQLSGSVEALSYLYHRAKDVLPIGKKKN